MDNARLPNAGVMELVDVPDSKSGAARRGGSSPPPGTKNICLLDVNQINVTAVYACDT